MLKLNHPIPARGGAVVQAADGESILRYRQLETRSRLEDRNVFRIQTLEGSPAYINTGQSVPIPTQTTVVNDGVEYRDVTSGFYVLPRLAGDNVTLFVSCTAFITRQPKPGCHI